jgi:hypothetical protein
LHFEVDCKQARATEQCMSHCFVLAFSCAAHKVFQSMMDETGGGLFVSVFDLRKGGGFCLQATFCMFAYQKAANPDVYAMPHRSSGAFLLASCSVVWWV